MAGSIIVSSITLDSDNNFSIKSNTGATLFFANTTGIDVANSIGATAITNDKILSVANTKITGNIISSQIAPSVTLNGNTTIASGNLTIAGLVRSSVDGFQIGNTTDSYAKFVYSGGSAALDITNEYNSGGAGSTYGQIVFKNYNSSGGSLTERVRITGSGNILAQKCISVGAATPSSDGAGITFPATQSTSSDANTLDDYEEGTFTPTATASGSIAGFTYVSQVANYVKIGKTVFINLNIQISSLAGGSSGNLRIGNLPFTVSTSATYGALAISFVEQTGGTAPNGAMATNTYINLYNNSGGSVTAVGFGALSAFNYYIGGTYTTT